MLTEYAKIFKKYLSPQQDGVPAKYYNTGIEVVGNNTVGMGSVVIADYHILDIRLESLLQ